MPSISAPKSKLRSDIQALRGLAVALVVLDHFRIGPFPAGFLGVDVFFVISGFLITGILVRDIDAGRFSFRAFYFRRAKRLLPAAYVTIALTVAGSFWFLASLESSDLTAQVIGALTFSINFVLYAQTDYFASSAAFKPLLHMWSLAIEEQFYLLFPLFLLAIPASRRMTALLLLAAASAALCMLLVRSDQALAFYMLPSRAWELGVGAIGAILVHNGWAGEKRLKILFYPALATLLIVPTLPDLGYHPGFAAAAVCAATLTVILIDHPSLKESKAIAPIIWLGNVSYSLYLVHWPVAAFINNAYIGEQPVWLRLLGLSLSLALASLLYRLVENPARKSPIALKHAAIVSVVASVCIATTQIGLVTASPTAEAFRQLRKPNQGLDATCDGYALFENEKCQSGPNPEILVWGDSYAMHLVPGIVATSDLDVAQATMSSCAPLVGWARDRPTRWVKRCIRNNEETLRRVLDDTTIRTVVLSSPFNGLTGNVDIWEDQDGELKKIKVTATDVVHRFKELVETLNAAGKRVIFVGPTPSLGGVDFSVCVERKQSGKLTFGDAACTINRDAAEAFLRGKLTFMDHVRQFPGIQYIDLFDVLCNGSVCETEVNGVSVYRDSGHLSYLGSVEVFRRLPAI